MKTTFALFAALCLPIAFTGCEGNRDKSGGDPSKPEPTPTPTATRSGLSSGSGGGLVPSPASTPLETPSASATQGNVIPGNSTSGEAASAPNGAPASGITSGANGSTGKPEALPTKAGAESGAVVARKAALCATMTVFNTGGNAVLVREQPQVGATEIDVLVEGTKVQAGALVNDAFVAVTVKGKQGYVHGAFLTCNEQASLPSSPGNSGNPGVDTATDGSANAVVRSGPAALSDCLK